MIRTNFYFPKELLARLAAESKTSGVPMSEILRRALIAELVRREAT